jgi:hypothetical protein
LLEERKGVIKDCLEMAWIDAVQDRANLVVGGEGVDPEHGVSVVEAAALLHEPLEGEEGGALKEETGEGSEREVVH